ncbi:MAG: cellulase family glycosylhydrolase [Ruminococcus sp.]|nr:cellulase family glycosylhydrolase [Ruminococcus sp.]
MKLQKKLIALAASAAIAVTSLAFPASAASLKPKDITSKMGMGWNLGNSLDTSNCSWITDENKYETGWGNPIVTKALIDKVKSLGFNTVRIPVSWHNHVDSSNNISSTWMNRVQDVVDYAIDDGMYVILNIHHDNTLHTDKKGFYPSSTYLSKSKSYVSAVWKQVSARFKNYDEHLIFETLNEPRLVGDTANEWWFNKDNPNSKVKDAISCINTLNQTALDTIRAAGGKNATRLVMCPGYGASIEGCTTSAFKLPKDSAGMTAVSLHAYTPYDFAMNASNGTATYSSNMQQQLKSLFSQVKSSFTDKGISVIIGEYGAFDKKNSSDRCKWAEDYISQATALGVPCVLWDNNAFYSGSSGESSNEKLGFLNRSTLKVADSSYCKALFKNAPQVILGNLKDASVTVKYDSYTYTGSAVTPDNRSGSNEITVKLGGKTLKKGTDYTVSYTGNTKVGKATATVKGKGQYEGSKSVKFIIKPAVNQVTKLTTAANKINVYWNADSSATGYQVRYSKYSSFSSSYSYTTTDLKKTAVTLSKYPKTGETWYIKVRSFYTTDGKTTSTRYGNYSDVQKIKVGSSNVIGSASLKYGSYTYTGSAITPDSRNGADELTVKSVGGKKLTKGTDYTVSYKKNKAVGTAVITIAGKGSYSGCVTKEFVIKPAVNAVTAISSTSGAFKISWKKATAGSTGYQVKYSTDKNFAKNVHSYTSTALSDLSENFSTVPKTGETWYVKVRSFVTKDGKTDSVRYGNYSSVKSVKIK